MYEAFIKEDSYDKFEFNLAVELVSCACFNCITEIEYYNKIFN